MDPDVPPRVTFWTGIWDPTREALSSQVDALRRGVGRASPVVSFSAGQRSALLIRERVVRLSSARWGVLRALGAGLERTGDVTHVFGEVSAWHLLRAVGRRPVLFTVAIPGRPLDHALYDKVSLFAAETEQLAESLHSAGIDRARIVVVRPGIDIERFRPMSLPPAKSRILFASSPAVPSEFVHRGIPLLVDAARLCPDIEFVLLWRKWGRAAESHRALADLNPPENVTIDHRDVPDMASVYQGVHATVLLSEPGYGKSCPNSVMEGLACGRPAIVSQSCGIAKLITEGGAGLAPPGQPAAVASAIRTVLRDHSQWRVRARELAERQFSLQHYVNTYRSLHERLAGAA